MPCEQCSTFVQEGRLTEVLGCVLSEGERHSCYVQLWVWMWMGGEKGVCMFVVGCSCHLNVFCARMDKRRL